MRLKSVFLTFVSFLFISLLSCTEKPEDIKMTDLKNACDYVDAFEKIADAVIKTKNGRTWNSLNEDEKKYIELLKDKRREFIKSVKKKYTLKELEECPNMERSRKKDKEAF